MYKDGIYKNYKFAWKKTSDNKNLPKKKVNRKENNKEIKIEKPILSISFSHDSIV